MGAWLSSRERDAAAALFAGAKSELVPVLAANSLFRRAFTST
jgi:hypothetical protein